MYLDIQTMKCRCLLLGLLVLVVGCVNKTTGLAEKIVLKKSQKVLCPLRTVFQSDTVDIIGSIGEMAIKGGEIVFTDAHPNFVYGLYVLDISTGKIISKYGRRGRGSNEYLSVSIINNDNTYNDENTVDIYDIQRNVGYCLKIYNDAKIKCSGEIIMPMEFDGANHINISGSRVVSKNVKFNELSLFKITDLKSGDLYAKAEFFDCSKTVKDLPYVYDSKLCANPASKVIFGGMTFFDYILVYDYQCALKKIFQFSDQPLPKLDDNGDLVEYKIYTLSTFCGSKYCYFIRYANNVSDLSANDVELIMMNWDGQYVGSYVLREDILNFCVDETTGRMYGATANQETGQVSIIEYSIDL